MADIETVARLLADFDRAVKSAGRDDFRNAMNQPNRTVPKVYEACVALLDDAERDELERLIEKMMPEAREPPRTGAVVP